MADSHPPQATPVKDMEAIRALLCRIDVALACQQYDMIVESLMALYPLLGSRRLAEAESHAALLEKVIVENSDACEFLHVQTRIDNLIQALRRACFHQ